MVRWWQTRVNTIPLFDSGEKTLLPKSVLTISCAKPNQFFAVFLCRQRSFPLKAKYRSRFLYSVILTEYAAIESRVCVYMYACMCVCVYVCAYVVCASVSVCVYVCDSATSQTDGWILMTFSTNDLTDICEVNFSRILTFRNRWRQQD